MVPRHSHLPWNPNIPKLDRNNNNTVVSCDQVHFRRAATWPCLDMMGEDTCRRRPCRASRFDALYPDHVEMLHNDHVQVHTAFPRLVVGRAEYL
jgi:hypothetical protein